EGFEFGAVGHEIQSAVGQHAVDVEDCQADVAGPFQQGQFGCHTTPARSRSCMFRAPTGRPWSSITKRPLILLSSMIFSASAAGMPWPMVLQPRVMTCSTCAVRISMSCARGRRRSPDVKMPVSLVALAV